jgi:hypothetical protein
VQFVHLPAHERIVVQVRRRRQELPPPIYPRTKRSVVFLCVKVGRKSLKQRNHVLLRWEGNISASAGGRQTA